MARLDLPCIGSAGGRLPVRTGDLYTGQHRQRPAAAAATAFLIKGGVYLEEGRKLRWLALDKTGTITHGKPAQTDFVTWGNALASDSRSIAASLAARPDHPVSKAVAQAAQTDGVALLDVAEFNALPGRGVQGQINGATYHLGKPPDARRAGAVHTRAGAAHRCAGNRWQDRRDVGRRKGGTCLIRRSGHHQGQQQDRHRRAARTGHQHHDADRRQPQYGTGHCRTSRNRPCARQPTPDDKLREVEQLARSGKVGMVGDGINDAPALARADVGFAMGAAGTDTAIETADVALMDDNLRKIPTFVRLSRATAQVLMQNIVLALGIKAVFLVLTFTGQATMWMAVFADMGPACSSLAMA